MTVISTEDICRGSDVVALRLRSDSQLRRRLVYCLVFFFFQAEDGIRDDLVTGVQTCALPICQSSRADGAHRSAADAREPAEPFGRDVITDGVNPYATGLSHGSPGLTPAPRSGLSGAGSLPQARVRQS